MVAAIAIGAILVSAALVLEHDPAGRARPATASASRSAKTAHAVLHRIGSHVELVVSGMPEPPIGEVYEVWLNRASGPPQPTDALFTVTGAGDGSVYVPGLLHGVRAVTVTSEPLGGSSFPTSAPVLRLRV